MTNKVSLSAPPSQVLAGLDRIASSPWAAAVGIALILLIVLHGSLQRTHFNMGVETDFTAGFGQDAMHILHGEALELPYHPPGFPFTAALARVLSGDWLAGGLWVSGISALVVLIAGFVTFRRLAGVAASWGVLVAATCSTTFLAFASTVSSDMLFAALASILLACVVSAMLEPGRKALWVWSGVAAACVMLSRANGLAAVAVLATPMLLPASLGSRLRCAGWVALGIAIPILMWVAYAIATHSPFAARGNHVNLAVAAYGDESKSWSEQSRHFAARFTSFMDVLTYDPVRLTAHVAKRFLLMPARVALELTWPVLALLAAPGLLWMLWKERTPALVAYLLVAIPLALLASLTQFRPRYFLFLVPIIGAMAALTFCAALRKFLPHGALRTAASLLALCVVGLVAARAHAPVLSQVELPGQTETGEALPQVRRLTEPNAVILARKSTLGFEAGRVPRQVPDVPSLAALLQFLCNDVEPGQPHYLHIGSAEREERAGLVKALSDAAPISWLQPVAAGVETEWRLYRVELEAPPEGRDARCAPRAGGASPGD